MATITCPICECSFDSDHSTSMPFCSKRCQQIDLGRWVNEEYGMPIESEHDTSEE